MKVHSLKAAPQYNGLSGVVAGPMHEGRHKVRVKLADGGIQLVQVKPSNLKEGNPVMEMLMNAKEKGPDGMADMDSMLRDALEALATGGTPDIPGYAEASAMKQAAQAAEEEDRIVSTNTCITHP